MKICTYISKEATSDKPLSYAESQVNGIEMLGDGAKNAHKHKGNFKVMKLLKLKGLPIAV